MIKRINKQTGNSYKTNVSLSEKLEKLRFQVIMNILNKRYPDGNIPDKELLAMLRDR